MFLPKLIGALATAAVLWATPSLAQTSETRATSEPWCIIGGGAMSCLYRTLPECARVMRPQGGECVPNPNVNFVIPEEFDGD
jgi:hypothetical protein